MNLIRAFSLCTLLCVTTIKADYIYEANQSLLDLTNEQNTTNMAVGDDQVSSAFNLDFTFTFYGEDFTSARMATNGCLHFGSSGSYCNDYTPDPLPEITYTLYPFWTDLIRDNGSKVLAKNFTDKSVFGWYNLREYNRSNTDNSFEVILWKADDSFEFRYGALNIINHDVLIGEQGTSSELYTYLFHDQCGKGTTNVTGVCVNSTWNQTAFNTSLENGGSLYSSNIDCTNPLNDSSCAGYESAYLVQQCSVDELYSTQCPNYWENLFDYECSYDSQYSPACPGYAVFTYVYEANYEEDNYGYTETYTEEEYYYEEEIYYLEEAETEYYQVYNDNDGTDTTPVDDTIGINPSEEHIESPILPSIYDDPPIFIAPQDEHIEQPQLPIIIDGYADDILIMTENYTVNYELPTTEDVLLNHFEHQEHFERHIEEYTEDEEILEEIAKSNEDEITKLEDEKASDDESEDRDEDIEVVVSEGRSKNKRSEQLNVVANTIRSAINSFSGTSIANTSSSNGASITSVASSSSAGAISMSNSPSISEQVSSSAIQTQQVLTMSAESLSSTNTMSLNSSAGETMNENETNVSASNSSVDINSSFNSDNTTIAQSNSSISSQNNASGSIDIQINETVSEMSPSDADIIADQIIAQNIQNQQEQIEQEQQETGQYADSTALVAFMGYVPRFNEYTNIQMPNASAWYEPEDIYANVSIADNNQAYSNMFGNNLTMLTNMVQSQPNL